MKQSNTRTLQQWCLSILLLVSVSVACNEAADTSHKANNWYQEKAWLGGLDLKPHETIDTAQFRREYEANKPAWDKAFAYLKNTDLAALAPGKHVIDSTTVYALVTEGPAKHPDTAKWESHQLYTDIHHVISGREQIAMGPIDSATVTTPYNAEKDIAFYTSKGQFYEYGTDEMFIIFPPVAHCPGVKVDGHDTIKKIVVKVRKGAN